MGEILHRRRLEFGYSLDDIEGALRIRQGHLAAIEEGRSEDLPAMVYVLGYVRSYARLLELDGDALARQFKEEAGVTPSQTELQFRVPDSESRGVPGGAAMLIGVVVAAVAYGGWYYLSTNDRSLAELIPALPERLGGSGTAVIATPIVRNPEPVAVVASSSATANLPPIPPLPAASRTANAPASPAIAGGSAADPRTAQRASTASVAREQAEQPQDVPPDNPAMAEISPGLPNAGVSLANANVAPPPAPRRDPTAAVAAMPAPASAPTTAPSGASSGRVLGATSGGARVAIRAVEESWLRIIDASNAKIHEGTLFPGDTYYVPDQPGLKLMTGNSGGLQIMVDGAPSPWMGKSGAVARNVLLEPASLMRLQQR